MIFESLWPLIFLGAIPIIIILYLLKPKGTDHLISSNLLWKKILQNQHAKTFFEKFTQNILMYIQMLITILLIISIMSPYINMRGNDISNQIILIDTSASMQHQNKNGTTIFDQNIKKLVNDIKNSNKIKISVITCDASGANLLALNVTDKNELLDIIKTITPSDAGGDLSDAQTIIDQINSINEEQTSPLMAITDAHGLEQIDSLYNCELSTIYAAEDKTSNVANEYMSCKLRDDGTYDVVVSATNYSDYQVQFDISLLDNNDSIIQILPGSLNSNETNYYLFEGINFDAPYLHSQLSGFVFSDNSIDSLSADNESFLIKETPSNVNALLVSDTNTFIEKAYHAVTSENLTKSVLPEYDSIYNLMIFDDLFNNFDIKTNSLIFHDVRNSKDTINNSTVTFCDSELSYALTNFQFGVNQSYIYDIPEWAHPLIECNGECVAYYGENNNIRQVVLGFDIRESNFALCPEFPIFISNVIKYLSSTGLLEKNSYIAGEYLSINSMVNTENIQFEPLNKAGIYSLTNEDETAFYTVKFATYSESDGNIAADDYVSNNTSTIQMIRHGLRFVLLLILLLLLIIEWIIYIKQMNYKGKFYLAFRSVLVLLLLIAIIDPQIAIKNSDKTTIFVVDMSESNSSHMDDIKNYLSDTINKMPIKNDYGIVAFGKNALLDQLPTSENAFYDLMTLPDKSATNFEDAIQKAVSLIPSSGRVVILTDGKETRGNLQNCASLFSSNGNSTKNVELLALTYDSIKLQDAYIDSVVMPTYLHPGDKYSVTIVIESNYETDSTLQFMQGNNLLTENTIHLNAGANRFTFEQNVNSDSLEELTFKIIPDGDECEDNNIYHAYSRVENIPKILMVTGKHSFATPFVDILDNAGIEYDMVSAINTPKTLEELLNYQSIILLDVYYDELYESVLNNINTYIKDYGRGLICCAGMHSYALGGYKDSLLEEILPVSMNPNNVNELPSMCMVMVIDHSGSMDTDNKLDLAIEAGKVAVDNLRPSDYVGIIGFDDTFKWYSPITQNTNPSETKSNINNMPSGGGTTIKPAVKEALDEIINCDVNTRHVLLLSDGQGETTDYKDIIEQAKNSKISISTVAIGKDADYSTLQNIAEQCNGRFYQTDNASELPNIFSVEVYLGQGDFIQEGDFTPSVKSGHDITNGIFKDGWPMINGYIASSPKSAASCLIQAGDKHDPILTVWQYGLGKTVSFNTDPTSSWMAGYASENDYVQLWKHIIEFSNGNTHIDDDQVDVLQKGDQTIITYTAKDYTGATSITAKVNSPNNETEEFSLHASAPGVYEATIKTDKQGLYLYNVIRHDNQDITSSQITGSAIQFSDEYKYNISNTAFMNFINKYGHLIDTDTDIWSSNLTANTKKRSFATPILCLIVLLFLIDIAMRRFMYEPPKIQLARSKKENTSKNETAYSYDQSPDMNIVEPYIVPELNTGSTNNKTKNKSKNTKKQNKKEPEETLDTSALLQKKKDRNI